MEEASRSSVAFRVLGPVAAQRDGEPLPLGGPRQRALLSLLLLEAGRPVAADRLIDELWTGAPPDGAEGTLRTYVSRLRVALGPSVALTASGAGYQIDVAGEAIDVRRFEQLIREGDEALAGRNPRRARDRLAAALALWRGEPFEDLRTVAALGIEAERLEGLRLLAIERRIEADLELGAAAGLVDELERLVREQPFRERLWRHLMLALYRSDRQADALEAYRRARDQLDEHLGIEPGVELERLQGEILRHEVPTPRLTGAHGNLPAEATSFVGRSAELAAVTQELEAHRLVTLTGVGGVGKTRLAVEVARGLTSHAPDGVWFVDLSSITDPDLVPGHVSTALDLREQPGVPILEHLAGWIRDRDLLLVLDNCEHLRDACAALADKLLRAGPGVRILATSRELLGVPGEMDQPVPPLALPARDDVAAARTSEAVRLLLDRARAVRPGLADSDEAVRIAARICADLDGLPLAIELAAARARALSLADIADRLADRFRFLVSWRRLTSARHRTLREAMDWSYDLLPDAERDLLAALSVFAGSFDLEAVGTVGAITDDEALRLIERLVDASLVVPLETPAGTRFRLLETVRQYAGERLDAAARSERRRAHIRHFLEIAGLAQVRGPDQAAALDRVEAELDNVRAALDYAAELDDPAVELRLAGSLWRFWWVRGHLAEGRARAEAVLGRAAGRPALEIADVLYGSGILAWSVGDYDRGRAVGAELLGIAAAVASDRIAHDANKLLSMVALRERDFAASEQYAGRTIELARRLGDELELATDQQNLAVLVMDSGRVAEAVPIFEDGLDRFRRSGNLESLGLAHLNLGEAMYLLDNAESAGEHFAAAREAFDEIGFRAHVGHAIRGEAGVAARQGRLADAARLLGRADGVLGDVGASEDDFAPSISSDAERLARAGLGKAGFTEAYDEGRRAGTGR